MIYYNCTRTKCFACNYILDRSIRRTRKVCYCISRFEIRRNTFHRIAFSGRTRPNDSSRLSLLLHPSRWFIQVSIKVQDDNNNLRLLNSSVDHLNEYCMIFYYYRCRKSGWPLCGPTCEKAVAHNAEVVVPSQTGTKCE